MKPALMVHGGRVWTGGGGQPYAEAFLVENGVFTAVGSDEQVKSAADGKNPERIDAKGSLVIPGITDAHMHLTAYCKGSLYLDLSDVTSISMLLERVKSQINAHPECHWFRATGYNETAWEKPTAPTMEMLDGVSGGKAMLVSRYCGHVHVANRRAITDGGLWDSADANVVRGENGEPNGVLHESAAGPILQKITEEHETPRKIRGLAGAACGRLASMGITAVHACDVPSYGLPEDISVFQGLREAGRLPLRVISYHDRLPNLSIRSGFGDRFVSYGGYKVFIDGNLGGFTSAMREDFSDRPGARGQLNHTDDALFEMLREAVSRGIQVQMHMIGDAATDQAIRVCQKLAREAGRPKLPFRFNHVIVSPPDQIAPLKELGAVLDVQPIQAFTDRSMAPSRLGVDRMGFTYSFRRLYDSGLLMTGSSDGPMENPNPWLGIWAAVCRTDLDGTPLYGAKRDEVLTLEEALVIYTRNPYRAIGWNEGYGTIRAGSRADFAILDGNPFERDMRSLRDTTVRATYLEGKRTYENQTTN